MKSTKWTWEAMSILDAFFKLMFKAQGCFCFLLSSGRSWALRALRAPRRCGRSPEAWQSQSSQPLLPCAATPGSTYEAMCVYIYIYIYIHTRTHTHAHTVQNSYRS